VRTGPHVVVAGTTAAGGDIAIQTREALRRIETALQEVGASMSDVVRTRMFVTDISL
jgi:enamine deaminase RidA (YjgF/YER057c/UK114 family)